jgi:hypothetical protein
MDKKNASHKLIPAGMPSKSKAIPKEAPGVMPVRKGPAKGFLNRVCKAKPDIPREIPANTAPNTRGNLKC